MRYLKRLFIGSSLGIILFLFFIGKTEAKNYSKTKRQNFTVVGENSKKWSAGIDGPTFKDFSLFGRSENIEKYPADELYKESWNTEFLKVYANIDIPDSFEVDVSDFRTPIEGKVISPYGLREGNHFHEGIDIKLQVGDTICAAFDGKVRIRKYEKGYGNYLALRHANGLETVYGHLSQFLVKQDQNVKSGDPIGLGGNTGRSYGPHLHFEFRFLGKAIDPAKIINFDDEFSLKDDIYVFMKNKSKKDCI